MKNSFEGKKYFGNQKEGGAQKEESLKSSNPMEENIKKMEREQRSWLAFELWNESKLSTNELLEEWEMLDPPARLYCDVLQFYGNIEKKMRKQKKTEKEQDDELLETQKEVDDYLLGLNPKSYKDFDDYFLPENCKVKAFALEKLAEKGLKNELTRPDFVHVFDSLKWETSFLFVFRNHLTRLFKVAGGGERVDYMLEEFIRYLESGVLDYDERQKKLLTLMFSDIVGVEKFRNDLAKRIEDTEHLAKRVEKELEKGFASLVENLRDIYSLIIPNSDKIAIRNLRNFYQNSIKFEEYAVNQKMNEAEVELLESLIGENEKVLEMGCGTGRLTTELVKDGYDITGFDFTKRHVDIAKHAIEQNEQEAKVFRGDWHNNAIKDESFETAYSLGRNILHDYSIVDQVQLFREAARILKPGGKFIFDIPNREKGGYKKMVEGYAEEMEKRGIKNFRHGAIYDSPDGEHFATRYAYSHQDIQELATISGFEIQKVEKRPLETDQEDENWYYVLKKI